MLIKKASPGAAQNLRAGEPAATAGLDPDDDDDLADELLVGFENGVSWLQRLLVEFGSLNST